MLYLVATPIGHPDDIALRALSVLQSCSSVICEDRKVTSRFLRHHQITGKNYLLLNEHTRDDELNELVELCRNEDVALVSDCGTPVFCDPGSRLIALCRKQNINIKTLPGASSLMCVLSLLGQPLRDFLFVGFLSANTEERETQLKKLQNEKRAMIFMDTPYRLQKMLGNLSDYFCGRKALLGLNLTQEDEIVIEAPVTELVQKCPYQKAEFIVFVYPV